MPISALAAWPLGWMQNVNFFVSGALNATFVIGVHHAIRPARFGFAGIALLLASCVGLVSVAFFPWIDVNGVPTETTPHVLGAVLTFSCASTGMVMLSRRMAADPEWQNLSAYVLATGIVMLILFIVVGGFSIEEGTPFHRWAGLLQRVLVGVWFTCLMVMARRALRVGRENRFASTEVPAWRFLNPWHLSLNEPPTMRLSPRTVAHDRGARLVTAVGPTNGNRGIAAVES